MQRIALIAGIGRLPVEFAKAARDNGFEVVTIAIVSDVDAELKTVSNKYYDINLVKAGKIISTIKKEKINKVTFLGKVTKEVLFSKWFVPDLRMLKMLAKTPDRSDDGIMLTIVNELAGEGIEVMDQTELLQKLFVSPGIYTKRAPTDAEEQDVELAMRMAKAMGGYDIGQTVVVKKQAIMAVEAIEGTNKCIIRGGELARKGAVVGKVAKPGQDKRFDVPAVGTETIEAMIKAKAAVLAVEAGQTLIVDLEKTVALADKHDIAIIAREMIDNAGSNGATGKTRIFLSAGEASGDLLGAALAKYLFENYPNVEIFGIGGKLMRAAGVRTLYDIADLSLIGFQEVIAKLPHLYRIYAALKKFFADKKMDVFCGIDYPGFNVKLAGIAKKSGSRTICYKAPSIWSWGEWRVRGVKRNVDYIAAILPFEAEAYIKHGVAAEYVGNPIVENVLTVKSHTDINSKYALDRERKIILLLPGSRKQEIQNLLPVILQSAQIIGQNHNVQFVLPIAASVDRLQIDRIMSSTGCDVPVVIADGADMYPLMRAATCAIATSGTVTLEAALLDMPCAIVYRTSASTYALLKLLAKIKYAGLPNLILNRLVLPEYLQADCRAELIANGVSKMLDDASYYQQIIGQFTELRQKLGGAGAVRRVADIILRQVEERKGKK